MQIVGCNFLGLLFLRRVFYCQIKSPEGSTSHDLNQAPKLRPLVLFPHSSNKRQKLSDWRRQIPRVVYLFLTTRWCIGQSSELWILQLKGCKPCVFPSSHLGGQAASALQHGGVLKMTFIFLSLSFRFVEGGKVETTECQEFESCLLYLRLGNTKEF